MNCDGLEFRAGYLECKKAIGHFSPYVACLEYISIMLGLAETYGTHLYVGWHDECATKNAKYAFLHSHLVPGMSRWPRDGGNNEVPNPIRPIPYLQVDVFKTESRKLHINCDHIQDWSVSKVGANEVNG